MFRFPCSFQNDRHIECQLKLIYIIFVDLAWFQFPRALQFFFANQLEQQRKKDSIFGYPFDGCECVFCRLLFNLSRCWHKFCLLHVPRIHVHIDGIATFTCMNVEHLACRTQYISFHRIFWWITDCNCWIEIAGCHTSFITSYTYHIVWYWITYHSWLSSHIKTMLFVTHFSALHTNQWNYGWLVHDWCRRFEWLWKNPLLELAGVEDFCCFRTMPFNLGWCLLHLKMFELSNKFNRLICFLYEKNTHQRNHS